MRFLLNGRVRWAVLGAVVAGVAAGGVAYAAIPYGGTISGCYQKSNGALRVIDKATNATCSNKEVALDWNHVGPTVPPGPPGATGPSSPAGPADGGGACPSRTLSGGTNDTPVSTTKVSWGSLVSQTPAIASSPGGPGASAVWL